MFLEFRYYQGLKRARYILQVISNIATSYEDGKKTKTSNKKTISKTISTKTRTYSRNGKIATTMDEEKEIDY